MRVKPRWVFPLTLLLGCYESHALTPPPEPPEEARLIAVRSVDGDTVVEVKELGGDIAELTRFPTDSVPGRVSVSPNQEWLMITEPRSLNVVLLNLETLEPVELVWSADRSPCEENLRGIGWSGSESILLTCGRSFSYPDHFVAGLDGVVRRVEVPPDCEVRGHERGSGLLLSRCDDGDYIINARGEPLSTIQGMPRLIINDYNAMVVASETSVTTYVREERGSRFWRWSEGAPQRGHFVPLVVLEDTPYWIHPGIAPGGSVSLGFGDSPSSDSARIFDPFSGTAHQTCVDEERQLSFSPAQSHVLVSCPDITTYLNVATGAAETIPTEAPFSALFSRDATRFIGRAFIVDAPYDVYDRSLGAWVDSWPGVNDVAWIYPTP